MQSRLGEGAVRVVAGFNLIVLSAIVGLCVARFVALLPGDFDRIEIPAFLIATVAAAGALIKWGPLSGGKKRVWIVLALFVFVALFSAAPIGILVLASVAIALLGRVVTQINRPRSIIALLHSPLPWVMVTVYALAAFAYAAQPPVLFPRAVVTTATGLQTGGYLARTPDGVYLVTCQGLADVTSRHARTVLIPANTITSTSLGGPPYRVDTGNHPSLLRLAIGALDLGHGGPTWFDVDFRTRRPTCGGLLPRRTDDKVLGPGVYVGKAPAGGRASDGEPPIERTTPALAKLARRLQPTVETTVADRFWPVSVGAVLKETTGSGFLSHDVKTTCLARSGRLHRHPPDPGEPQPARRDEERRDPAADGARQRPDRPVRGVRARPADPDPFDRRRARVPAPRRPVEVGPGLRLRRRRRPL